MGVARIRNGKITRITTRDAQGRELASYNPVPSIPEHSPLPSPTILDMARRASSALGTWAARGFPIAPREVRLQRLAICSACPHWQPAARLGLGKCNHPGCGCTKAKLFLATERCPLRKW